MAMLLPWTTVEIGELEVSAPAVPCLVVHTWYVEDRPNSTVTYFWQDESTGAILHEMVFAEPVGFEDALRWAQDHALQRGVERIHVKHGPSESKGQSKGRSLRAKSSATQKKRQTTTRKRAGAQVEKKAGGRRPSSRVSVRKRAAARK